MSAQGAWQATAEIPGDQGSAGSFDDVYNRSQVQLRDLIETAAKSPSDARAVQIGGLYNAFMDEPRVEALDDKPLQPDLARIAAIKSKAELSAYMGYTAGAFGISVVDPDIGPDPKQPELNVCGSARGGLGLPDRDYYLTDGFKPQRDAYLAYIQRTLTMVGYPDPAANAQAILDFETAIAKVSWPVADRREIEKLNNPMTPAELQAYAPGVDWAAFLTAAGAPNQPKVIVGENSAIQKIAGVYADTPLPGAEGLGGVPRRQRGLALPVQAVRRQPLRLHQGALRRTDPASALEARRYPGRRQPRRGGGPGVRLDLFPAGFQGQDAGLVANLKTAMAGRIQNATWMSDTTKAEALKKLAKMDVQVGYPTSSATNSA